MWELYILLILLKIHSLRINLNLKRICFFNQFIKKQTSPLIFHIKKRNETLSSGVLIIFFFFYKWVLIIRFHIQPLYAQEKNIQPLYTWQLTIWAVRFELWLFSEEYWKQSEGTPSRACHNFWNVSATHTYTATLFVNFCTVIGQVFKLLLQF
jgi:hypothetical protein